MRCAAFGVRDAAAEGDGVAEAADCGEGDLGFGDGDLLWGSDVDGDGEGDSSLLRAGGSFSATAAEGSVAGARSAAIAAALIGPRSVSGFAFLFGVEAALTCDTALRFVL